MPPTGEEIGWWREAFGAISATLVAVGTWSFVAGRKSREFEQRFESVESKQEDVEQRLVTVEQKQEALGDGCSKQRKEIIEELKVEVLRVVQQAMSAAALQQLEQTGEIRTNIAVIQALIGEMQEDIKAIFDRLERRKTESYPLPFGERRDQ